MLNNQMVLGMSSSQLTFTPSFFRGVGQPPTSHSKNSWSFWLLGKTAGGESQVFFVGYFADHPWWLFGWPLGNLPSPGLPEIWAPGRSTSMKNGDFPIELSKAAIFAGGEKWWKPLAASTEGIFPPFLLVKHLQCSCRIPICALMSVA